jgi:N-acetylglucosaminyl-diphospho-decaprenol L-rhamnosyltransferase
LRDNTVISSEPAIDIVCVSYGSWKYLEKLLPILLRQEAVDQKIFVLEQKEGSEKPSDLLGCHVYVQGENLGYAGGNNYGFGLCRPDSNYVVFINPDCFPASNQLLANATKLFDADPAIGAVGPVLLGFDFGENRPSNVYDSLGIERSWYGHWRDAGQGILVSSQKAIATKAVVLCGACLICRREALNKMMERDGFIFDPRYFMYKEDIDFSLRLQDLGYKTIVASELEAFHCRGWQANRRKMPWRSRFRSALNELRVNSRWPIPALYSFAKLCYVCLVESPKDFLADRKKNR